MDERGESGGIVGVGVGTGLEPRSTADFLGEGRVLLLRADRGDRLVEVGMSLPSCTEMGARREGTLGLADTVLSSLSTFLRAECPGM
jgi:hypothetical protein